jgi:hypothetical protein
MQREREIVHNPTYTLDDKLVRLGIDGIITVPEGTEELVALVGKVNLLHAVLLSEITVRKKKEILDRQKDKEKKVFSCDLNKVIPAKMEAQIFIREGTVVVKDDKIRKKEELSEEQKKEFFEKLDIKHKLDILEDKIYQDAEIQEKILKMKGVEGNHFNDRKYILELDVSQEHKKYNYDVVCVEYALNPIPWEMNFGSKLELKSFIHNDLVVPRNKINENYCYGIEHKDCLNMTPDMIKQRNFMRFLSIIPFDKRVDIVIEKPSKEMFQFYKDMGFRYINKYTSKLYLEAVEKGIFVNREIDEAVWMVTDPLLSMKEFNKEKSDLETMYENENVDINPYHYKRIYSLWGVYRDLMVCVKERFGFYYPLTQHKSYGLYIPMGFPLISESRQLICWRINEGVIQAKYLYNSSKEEIVLMFYEYIVIHNIIRNCMVVLGGAWFEYNGYMKKSIVNWLYKKCLEARPDLKRSDQFFIMFQFYLNYILDVQKVGVTDYIIKYSYPIIRSYVKRGVKNDIQVVERKFVENKRIDNEDKRFMNRMAINKGHVFTYNPNSLETVFNSGLVSDSFVQTVGSNIRMYISDERYKDISSTSPFLVKGDVADIGEKEDFKEDDNGRVGFDFDVYLSEV